MKLFRKFSYLLLLLTLSLSVFAPDPNTNTRIVLSDQQLLAETKAWLKVLPSRPAPKVVYAVNDFIKTCKQDGTWQLLDRFWLFAQDKQANAVYSIVNPSSTACTEVNSPSWTAYRGYTGNGTSSYLNSNYNETSNGVNFTQNSASIFVYSRTNENAATTVEIGHSDATNKTFIACRSTANQVSIPINMSSGVGSPALANTDGSGFFQLSRTASNLSTCYRNGGSLGTSNQVSNGIVNNNMYICADNLAGVASLFSVKQISIAAVGGGGINASKFYTAAQR
jgi:hypothetical protein